MGPLDLPWKLKRVEDPRCFSLSSAYLPPRICSVLRPLGEEFEALESEFCAGVKNPRACPCLSTCLFFSLDLWVCVSLPALGLPSSTPGRVKGGGS